MPFDWRTKSTLGKLNQNISDVGKLNYTEHSHLHRCFRGPPQMLIPSHFNCITYIRDMLTKILTS